MCSSLLLTDAGLSCYCTENPSLTACHVAPESISFAWCFINICSSWTMRKLLSCSWWVNTGFQKIPGIFAVAAYHKSFPLHLHQLCRMHAMKIASFLWWGWKDESWKNVKKELSISAEIFNKSWYSYTGDLSKESYIQKFNWFLTWFEREKVEIFELFLTALLTVFIRIILFEFNSIK